MEGYPVHTREIEAICRNTNLSVELGGGLRSLEAVEEAFGLGVDRVVIGTAAYENNDFIHLLCNRFPAQIVVGIDARYGKVAVKGWKETTALDAVELAKRCEAEGASRIVYTDISRDGTREWARMRSPVKLDGSIRPAGAGQQRNQQGSAERQHRCARRCRAEHAGALGPSHRVGQVGC